MKRASSASPSPPTRPPPGGTSMKREQRSEATRAGAPETGPNGEGASPLPALAWLRARRQQATAQAEAYNRAHPEACAELNRLTGDTLGRDTAVDVPALRAWQGRHGLIS